MTAIKGIVGLLLAAAAGLAAAATIYKYERPGGELVYSDAPVSGARLLERLDLPAPLPPAQSPVGESLRGRSELAETRGAELDAADARIKQAAQALKDAEERQRKGLEPRPGERLGRVGGGSRLAPSYFTRQQDNAVEVDTARANLDEAYRLRNAARD
jgi:Domain of unknown function (DUF4124)